MSTRIYAGIMATLNGQRKQFDAKTYVGVMSLHCTALHCTALYCTALHCIALHCIALHCTALHYCTDCTVVHCTALNCCTSLCMTSVHLELFGSFRLQRRRLEFPQMEVGVLVAGDETLG